ncbi:methyl-accepting chemotaxis protein [Pullulanibacillus pueri]|uniref:Methyl-accepting chemotaxis protein n=1 Tax=Pullulanibacillus pueri TaxID=1437324 RepID=A0A8J3ER64_9BACL|nr:methyl-accepting chemotaxis protein [Pullulanibacillus pueri]MBM7683979.1 methyl-accepting chemotaxis protein [Pullulanibacillus pueri]GGH88141.1 hypothetical protein GCM10007096_39800 [Pullulanibacillus pueri]
MNWTIKTKIAIILFASLIGILIISSFMIYSSITQVHQSNKIKQINNAVYLAQDINKKMDTARKNDQNFLLNPSDQLVNEVNKNIDSLTKSITKLNGLGLGIGTQTKILKSSTEDYSLSFNNLAASKKVIGYTEDSGKLGALKSTFNKMTKIINNTNNEKLQNLSLSTKLIQTQFINKPTTENYNTLVEDINKMDELANETLKNGSYSNYSALSISLMSDFQSLNSFKNFETSSINSYEKIANTVTKNVNSTISILTKEKNSLYQKQEAIQRTLLITMIILGIFVLIILSLFGGWLYRSVSQSIRVLRKGAFIIGDGDLSYRVPIKGKDEFAELATSFNQMASSMESTMTKVTGAAERLSSSSQNLAAISEETNAQAVEVNEAVQQVAIGAQNQAEHLEESMALLTKVSGAIHQTSSFSEAIGKQSNKAQEANQQGLKVVSILEEGSTQFLEIAKHLISDIQGVAQQSTEIISILKVIKDISSNTDLLALNAAIESARAGEAGRGFEVVSHEIRNLAERSKMETTTIESVIKNIINKLNDISEAANHLNQSLNKQDYNVKQTKSAFDDIDKNVDSINSGIEKINNAVDKVTSANKALSSKLEEISAISEETSASTEHVSGSSRSQTEAIEEVNKAAQSLQDISLILEQEVAKFEFSTSQDDPLVNMEEDAKNEEQGIEQLAHLNEEIAITQELSDKTKN